jgi:hypothetical protein
VSDQPSTQDVVRPLAVDTAHVILAGMAVWLVALVVTLAVPELRTGDRSWWPWSCVTGLVLGALGLVYLRRGRGNAAMTRQD